MTRPTTTGPTPGTMTGRGPGWAWLTLTMPNGRKVTIQADRLDGETEYASAECVVGMYAAAPDMLEALRDLVRRCDGDAGVRADGSNIDTVRAHAALARAEGTGGAS